MLPYGNEAYEMLILLPRVGKTIADVLEEVNPQNLFNGAGEWKVDVKLPRFEVESDVELTKVLPALGMPSAFSDQTAEFPYFCNCHTWIDMMKQSAKIKVNEKGTEAAAVTVMGFAGGGLNEGHANFHADRPFLYLIREQSTGAIFFIGQYVGEPDVSGVESPTVHSHQSVTDGPWYNLQGQRLNTLPAKGIVIRDGKLVVVK
jgi:serpin B